MLKLSEQQEWLRTCTLASAVCSPAPGGGKLAAEPAGFQTFKKMRKKPTGNDSCSLRT